MSRLKKSALTVGLLLAAPLEAFLTTLLALVLNPLHEWINKTLEELAQAENHELRNPDGSPMVTTLEDEINQWPSKYSN